ncbi:MULTISPECIES: class I SAM-dependent methyltransferase [Streptomycetaceae]|uniref:ToxA protein n=1 Tax=Streptantibioticus cattleyicolor (strain ATCC 35852 / DSM 46488 / JCM 4925 / NBRC 14057 / NRRL 8057) TaxID=1003195 RepID=F8JQK4_STREN|nr:MULTISPECIES: class I SAM-dependent methyltransferase [Streptomycetaceae]AEW97851.1 toxA protein [Streptantibioticus cattleyicolor NRRL 8057 = DSM 46488]MYS62265.1 methyltransferase domain-containing protein [Streptomyces sp. SID5468]CCB78170.1 ToxA protein [Streptantibioticus cattleyicolor NRRL 8057 = DSM 46488]
MSQQTSPAADQYAVIGDHYSDFKQTAPLALPEQHTVLTSLGDLRGLRVLDLACGHGHYTRLIKRAGAAEVVGVDLSPVMVDLARGAEAADPLGISYLVADAVDLPRLGGFDVVSAVWLLNYATTKDELTAMFRGIHRNLVPGGRFAALTVWPGFDANGPAWDAYGLRVVSETPDGDRGVLVTDLLAGDHTSTITTSRWSAEAVAECLRAAGFESSAWHGPRVPQEAVDRFGDAFWDDYRANPMPAVLTATRPAEPVGAAERGADVRDRAHQLSGRLAAGDWHPSALARRVAALLLTATAGHGALTAAAIRGALWEGGEPLAAGADGALARLLADSLPLVESGDPAGLPAAGAVHDLLRQLG